MAQKRKDKAYTDLSINRKESH